MTAVTLVINPGSTSTKLALFASEDARQEETIRHPQSELAAYENLLDQIDYRLALVESFLTRCLSEDEQLNGIVARGGLLQAIPGGTYAVNETMLADLMASRYGLHACNLGAILADKLASKYDVSAYIVDPVVVDELNPLARYSGVKEFDRRSVGHALNQKAMARQACLDLDKEYEDSQVIVAHMGGGISIGAHSRGQMIDMVNGLDGEGPFTPERSGALPLFELADYILTNDMSMDQVKSWLVGNSGLMSYLGENDLRIVEENIQAGDKNAAQVVEAMSYQVAKSMVSLAAVVKGQVDGLVLTGGLAYSQAFTEAIKERIDWLAPVCIYPGEQEMEALYQGFMRVVNGQEKAKTYLHN